MDSSTWKRGVKAKKCVISPSKCAETADERGCYQFCGLLDRLVPLSGPDPELEDILLHEGHLPRSHGYLGILSGGRFAPGSLTISLSLSLTGRHFALQSNQLQISAAWGRWWRSADLPPLILY